MTTQKTKYKVGLIGAGRAGVPRARAFDMHPLCEIVAIADTDRNNLDLASKRFGVPGYHSWEEMLTNHKLDIGMAVLPVRPNADAVVALAQAGVRAIFCEKPLTSSLADADRMIEETDSRGIPLICGVVVSSHADYQKAYAMVASGEIGDVVRMNLCETNGQLGTHGLTQAYRFAGRTDAELVIGWVSGDPSSETEDEHEDGKPGYGALGGYVRFKNGIELFSNYQAPNHYWKGLEIMGTKGVLFGSATSGLGLRLFTSTTTNAPTSWDELEEIKGTFRPASFRNREYDEKGWRDPGEIMLGIVDEIVEYLEKRTPIGASRGDDMRHALEIAIAMRESARDGHKPVRLPIEDRSITMLPEKSRWFYKKTLMGDDDYMAQLAAQKRE